MCAHVSIAARQQPWLPVQAPTSLLLLNFHFPATLKGPLAPAYPAGVSSGVPPCFLTSSGGRIALTEQPLRSLVGLQAAGKAARAAPWSRRRSTRVSRGTPGATAPTQDGASATKHRAVTKGCARAALHCDKATDPIAHCRPGSKLTAGNGPRKEVCTSPSALSKELDRFQRQCYVYLYGGCVNKPVQGINWFF